MDLTDPGSLGLLLIHLLNAPNGPGTPFATPELALSDSLRLLVLLSLLYRLPGTLRLIRVALTTQQRYRMVALGLFMVMVVLSEIAHLGNEPNYQLLLALVASGYVQLGYQPTRGRWSRRER